MFYPRHMSVTLAVGTLKGAFLLRSGDRVQWEIEGPFFKGWNVSAFGSTASGERLLATASNWYGAAIHRSKDLSEWQQIVEGPAYTAEQERQLTQIWRLAHDDGRLMAGVDQAGLFHSEDDGASWLAYEGLNEHPTRSGWQPGLGGECAHAILTDPRDPDRIWCGISAVGVFRSDDGGATWAPKNLGVEKTSPSEQFDEIGYCVHGLAAHPDDPDLIFRQDHQGVYRTTDGGDHWERIEEGLPASFGFAVCHDRASDSVFVIPMESDEYRLPVDGRLNVYRTTDRGSSWHVAGTGLGGDVSYTGVLRGAISTDGLDPGGIYFGTTSGSVHMSVNSGDEWTTLPYVLPRVTAVHAFVE